jgi:7-keto-8-aminopelargonate synthetase-like enzyme
MDGDRAPLSGVADLKDQYGAWLVVDEAHATGLPARLASWRSHPSGRVAMGTLEDRPGSSGLEP